MRICVTVDPNVATAIHKAQPMPAIAVDLLELLDSEGLTLEPVHLGSGDPELARAMIDAAAEAGCDTVKFQSWRPEKLVVGFPDVNQGVHHGSTAHFE